MQGLPQHFPVVLCPLARLHDACMTHDAVQVTFLQSENGGLEGPDPLTLAPFHPRLSD